jgi:hypothetical protein
MTIKLNNPEIEHFFVSEFKSDMKAFSDFILKNLNQYKKQKEFNVTPLDPKENSYTLTFDDIEEVTENDNPFKNVDDVATYAKELRDTSWR